jgi:hypothetical protein
MAEEPKVGSTFRFMQALEDLAMKNLTARRLNQVLGFCAMLFTIHGCGGIDTRKRDAATSAAGASGTGGSGGESKTGGAGGHAAMDVGSTATYPADGAATGGVSGSGGGIETRPLDGAAMGGMTGSGGIIGSGGMVGSGGAATASGLAGSGGIPGSGGPAGTGGTVGSGGTIVTGGTVGSGGGGSGGGGGTSQAGASGRDAAMDGGGAGSGGGSGGTIDSGPPDSPLPSCQAPTIVSPTPGASTGASVQLRTTAPSCLTMTRCYLNSDSVAVASSTGAIDVSVAVVPGCNQIQCNGWDSTGKVYSSPTVEFTSEPCGPPTIVSPTWCQSAASLGVQLTISAPSCLTAVKCYLNGNETPIASADGGIDAPLEAPAGSNRIQCNGWESNGTVHLSPTVDFTAGGVSNIPLSCLMGHNTSAFPAYDQSHFSANFGTESWVSQGGATIPVDPAVEDLSLNPVTPGHVSQMDVHTLIPSRPDLRWFAHVTPWFRRGKCGSHIDIGLDNDSMADVRAMITDMQARGFDGLIVDWYGKNSYENKVTLLIQDYLAQYRASNPNRRFTFAIMMDVGIPGIIADAGASSSPQAVLETEIQYCQSQYFNDPSYELEQGKPILMFFGVDSRLGSPAMAAAKANTGGAMVWVAQGPSALSESWADQCFDWTHDVHDGVSPSDPYNLAAVENFYSSIRDAGKKAFGSMMAGFNGTLTKSVLWSMGKYLPRGAGVCLVQWAKKIDSIIPPNVTRMQFATWNDVEEGTAIYSGVENRVEVSASVAQATLSWTCTRGDESTIDHYEVFSSANAVDAVRLGSYLVSTTHSLDLRSLGLASGTAYELYVKAVGKPNIRDHMSSPVPYSP